MNGVIEAYDTAAREAGPFEFKEKGSRFISYVFPIKSQDEVKSTLNELKRQFHDATHICFAYRIGEGREDVFRYSDDGEPGGTAGKPIYNEIIGQNYYNILVAVIRYYGGTKLGTGGLSRAYQRAAREILSQTDRKSVLIKNMLKILFAYELLGEVRRVINHFALEIITEKYGGKNIKMEIWIPVREFEKIQNHFIKTSKGKIKFLNT